MDIIKWLIKVAIESFTIHEWKKEELLKSIMQKKECGGDKDVLR